jgi:hypothetical protein
MPPAVTAVAPPGLGLAATAAGSGIAVQYQPMGVIQLDGADPQLLAPMSDVNAPAGPVLFSTPWRRTSKK